MTEIQIEIKTEFKNPHIKLPEYKHPGDAGMDICADIDVEREIYPGEIQKIPTGLYVALPEVEDNSFAYEMQIRARSGLASKGLTLANGVGTVDAGYRGEVCVLLANIGADVVTVSPGERIAQIVVAFVPRWSWKVVESLPESSRGTGGFGSTGSR